MARSASARAPSSTANLGPGFDVFGLAMDAFYDRVTLTVAGSGVTVVTDGDLPTDPRQNTAGLVVRNMRRKLGIRDGVRVAIKKGVPAGFGMGSSAASAAAAAVAFDRLFGLGLGANELVGFAGSGEAASAGSVHYDNVAASVLGGFVIVRTSPLDVVRMAPPRGLRMCVAVPEVSVPRRKTEVSRGVLPERAGLGDCVRNISNAAAMVAGFARGDAALIGGSAADAIAEPARRHMIPGFDRVRRGALGAGASGVAISGAGPSVIAFGTASSDMDGIARAMSRGFASAGTGSRTVICRPARGAAGAGRGAR